VQPRGDHGGDDGVDVDGALATARRAGRAGPAAALVRERNAGRLRVVGNKCSGAQVERVFLHEWRSASAPSNIGTEVLHRDDEDRPGRLLRSSDLFDVRPQLRMVLRPPMRVQMSRTMTAPMTEPMMPDGWKKPLSLWKIR
jgi:hypothetical protein